MIVHSKAGKGVETMSESTHIHYRVDAVSKADLEEARPISTRLSEMLLAEPTSIEVQDVLQNCYLENRWISCSCSRNAYLAIRKTTSFYCLVRMNGRSDHSSDCAFSELHMPIYRKKLAEKITGNAISFHRPKPVASSKKPAKAPITVAGIQAESSRLARFMFTLYDEAGLNQVDLVGDHDGISEQYTLIKRAAQRFTIEGQNGAQILYTHPKDFDRAKTALYELPWGENQIPQVLLFVTIDSISGRTLRTTVGGETFSFDIKSKVEHFFDSASPPYNCLMTLALRPESDGPEILRCVAVPVYSKYWLLPVRASIVREFIKSVMWHCDKRGVGSAEVLTPFFPVMFRERLCRPDFSIERDSVSRVMIYFTSADEEHYDVRMGEIDFLRSAGLRVYRYDMDEHQHKGKRHIWGIAKQFYDEFLMPDEEECVTKSMDLRKPVPQVQKDRKPSGRKPVSSASPTGSAHDVHLQYIHDQH